jgi:hypothetical protein
MALLAVLAVLTVRRSQKVPTSGVDKLMEPLLGELGGAGEGVEMSRCNSKGEFEETVLTPLRIGTEAACVADPYLLCLLLQL